MLTTHHTRERRTGQALGQRALLVLMLLAVLVLPMAAQAQDGTIPLPADPPAETNSESVELLFTPEGYKSSPMPSVDESLAPADADVDPASAAVDQLTLDAALAGNFRSWLPFTTKEWAPEQADRLGFNQGSRSLGFYPQIRNLNAGWYINWGVNGNPPRPAALQYMQMVRVHQTLTCPVGTTADRTLCPYATPATYTFSPSADQIRAVAKRLPGSIWIIGNEMDRVDWIGGAQDEMTPEVYARAYHDLYQVIKGADATARVAIGGVIQFTPLRAEYLTKIWNSYKAQYGVNMPVDVWNIHNFIGPEYCVPQNGQRVCYGMAIPPGTKGTTVVIQNRPFETGAYFQQNWKVINQQVFEEQIRGMRAWMKARGQQAKPLIVTEYGVLWPSLCPDNQYPTPALKNKCITGYGANYVNLEDPAVIHEFMTWSFDFFRTEKDCALVASTYDECRLVQAWAWYALDDAGWGFNPHAQLADPVTGQLTPAGEIFANYASTNFGSLQLPGNKLP